MNILDIAQAITNAAKRSETLSHQIGRVREIDETDERTLKRVVDLHVELSRLLGELGEHRKLNCSLDGVDVIGILRRRMGSPSR